MHKPHVEPQVEPQSRTAYAAAVCAGLFAGVSAYWGLGGTAGVHSVGGYAERLAHTGGAGAQVAIWAVVAAKSGVAVLALSLVQPWGAAFSRRLRAGLAGATTVILTAYGLVFEVVQGLVLLRVIRPSTPVNWSSLAWHFALWDAWFVVWGLLLGAATWRFARHQGEHVPPAPKGEADRAAALT